MEIEDMMLGYLRFQQQTAKSQSPLLVNFLPVTRSWPNSRVWNVLIFFT
jgi:hypothetical protein